jgi:RND family efflux transporter MFP subunit
MTKRPNVRPLFCVIAASVFAGCSAHAAQAPGAAGAGPPPASVSTAKITRGEISTYVSFAGQITPIYQTTLSTAEAGTVAAVNVTEGDFVRKGQLLASLDTSQLRATLKANQATVSEGEAQLVHSDVAAPIAAQQYSSAVATGRQNLDAAINNVRTARASLTSDNLTQQADFGLLHQGYVSRETYEEARATFVLSRETLRSNLQAVTAQQAALRTALSNTHQRLEDQATIAQNAAGLENARANVELLQAQIEQASIVAPFDGQVTQRLLDPGAYAGASTGIFELAQLARVYVVVNVPDVDLPAIARGKTVAFTTTSLPGRTFHGRIFDVNLTPTSGTLSYRVRLLQPNPNFTLRGGMLVTVTAMSAHHAGVLLVPSAAVDSGAKGSTIFTVVDGKAHSIPVRVGLQTDTQAEVRGDGLAPGTTVVTSPPTGLQNGSAVADHDAAAAGGAPAGPGGQ